MNFGSDTSAPAHPAVIEAMARANTGYQPSYGEDAVMGRVRTLLAETLETDDFDFWIVSSGTAANALALACLCSSTGAILCHEEAHIERDERGAPVFFTGGAQLRLLPGFGSRIDPDAFEAALAGNRPDFFHETPLHALSLTNLTECGTRYTAAELTHFTARAKSSGLGVHFDGARLANAIAASGDSPAGLTWRCGADAVSFGLSKTGGIGCEVILLFGPARAKFQELRIRAKRAGHVPAKMRYLAAQAEAMLTGGLWLDLAAKANTSAAELAAIFTRAGIPLRYPREGNEVFADLAPDQVAALRSKGAIFYEWPGGTYRFICSWVTADADLRAFEAAL